MVHSVNPAGVGRLKTKRRDAKIFRHRDMRASQILWAQA